MIYVSIFGSASDSGEKKDVLNIKIGNKLNFQIDDSEIFGGVRYKEVLKEK